MIQIPYSIKDEESKILIKEKKVLMRNVSIGYCKKRVSVLTQQYHNGDYVEEIVNNLTTKIRQRKKSMTTTDKEDGEGSFYLKTSIHNIMYNFFYSNVSDFTGYWEGMLDKGICKTSMQNTHKLGWK